MADNKKRKVRIEKKPHRDAVVRLYEAYHQLLMNELEESPKDKTASQNIVQEKTE